MTVYHNVAQHNTAQHSTHDKALCTACRPLCIIQRFDILGIWLAGDSSTPLEAAVSSSTALTLRKKIEFEGLQVELFQDIDDPVAAAEGENVMSQMRSAELQLATDLEGSDPKHESFEQDSINIEAQDDFESSSIESDHNRSAQSCRYNLLGACSLNNFLHALHSRCLLPCICAIMPAGSIVLSLRVSIGPDCTIFVSGYGCIKPKP